MLPPLPPAAAPQLSAPRLRAARCPPCAARGRTSRFRHHREPLSCGKRERRRTDTSPADGDENKGVYAEHGRCHRGLPEALPAAPVPAGMATAASPDPPSPEGITCRFAVGNAGPRGFAVVCRAVPASREELSNRPLRDSVTAPGRAPRRAPSVTREVAARAGGAGRDRRGGERRGGSPGRAPRRAPQPSRGRAPATSGGGAAACSPSLRPLPRAASLVTEHGATGARDARAKTRRRAPVPRPRPPHCPPPPPPLTTKPPTRMRRGSSPVGPGTPGSPPGARSRAHLRRDGTRRPAGPRRRSPPPAPRPAPRQPPRSGYMAL